MPPPNYRGINHHLKRDLISIIIFIICIFTLRQGAKVLCFLHNIVYYGPYFMGKEVGGW